MIVTGKTWGLPPLTPRRPLRRGGGLGMVRLDGGVAVNVLLVT